MIVKNVQYIILYSNILNRFIYYRGQINTTNIPILIITGAAVFI